MADGPQSANTFQSLLPTLKESYSSGPMKTHERPGSDISYGDKIAKAALKPNNKRYFSLIKKKLKQNKR